MSKKEFLEIINGLKSMYGDKMPDMTQFAVEIWYESMKDMDYSKTKQAIVNHVKSNKYPPTVADIREQYGMIGRNSNSDRRKLEDLFREMRNYYPNGHKDTSAETLYFSYLCDVPTDERLEVAMAIRNTVLDYVKRCEQKGEEFDKDFSDCIRWSIGDL